MGKGTDQTFGLDTLNNHGIECHNMTNLFSYVFRTSVLFGKRTEKRYEKQMKTVLIDAVVTAFPAGQIRSFLKHQERSRDVLKSNCCSTVYQFTSFCKTILKAGSYCILILDFKIFEEWCTAALKKGLMLLHTSFPLHIVPKLCRNGLFLDFQLFSSNI